MENAEQASIVTEALDVASCPKCGAQLDVTGLEAFTEIECPQCQSAFQVPAKFGAFVLLERLGQGGMGGVYRAVDTGLNREVAIKVMLKSLGDDPQFVESFQREAQAAAKLNNPNIAQIYSFGKEQGQPYISMELVTGGSLDRTMAKEGAMSPGVVMTIGRQIAQGLSDAADAGLVHGDVKPENILFDNDGNAKLVDFGLAAMLAPEGEIWGTPYYISPEKVQRKKIDFRADIYSLGGTLYHAICGKPPYDGPDATAVVKARFEQPYTPMTAIRPDIPPELDAIIARMLELDPAKRYPTYRSLVNDISKYLESVGPVAVAPKAQKKFVIKGSKAAAAATVANTEANATAPATLPVPEEDDSADKHRGCKIFALIGLGVILFAGAVTGGIFAWLHHQKVSAERAEAAKIEEAENKIRANIETFVNNAKDRVAKLKALPSEAMGYAKTASNEAINLLGENFKDKLVAPEPPDYELPSIFLGKTEPPPTPVAETNAPPQETAATNAPVAEAAAEEKPQETEEIPPVVGMVYSMYEDAWAVDKAYTLAKTILSKIEEFAKGAEKFTQVTKEDHEALAKLNNDLKERFDVLAYDKRIAEMNRKTAALKKTLESVRNELRSLEAFRAQEKLEAEKRAKAEAAAKAAKQAEEAAKAKAAAEVAKVGEAEKGVFEALRAFDFRKAKRELGEVKEELETDAGQEALEVAQQRVKRVEDFQKWLSEKAVGYKSARGWSIKASDAKSLTVGSTKMQWLDIYTSKFEIFAELIAQLVVANDASKGTTLRERCKNLTNAALALSIFYPDREAAMSKAKELANEAAEKFEADADDVRALLPQFFE